MSGAGARAGAIERVVVVEVPATIANLGAGYDCLGMAIELELQVEIAAVEGSEIELIVVGEGAGELPSNRTNRLVQALDAGLSAAGVEGADGLGWRIRMTNRIPLSRGLGSSAAATVAGLLAASALARPDGEAGAREGGGALSVPTILRLATRFEGHPDNVAPALLGGVAASLELDDRVEAIRLDVPAGLTVVLFIPDATLSTAAMRAVLPASVPRSDAVANLGRVAIGVAGLAAGRLDVLGLLTEDRLHEPYRAATLPALPRLVAAAREAGALGACLAGAGSSVVAFVDRAEVVDQIRAAFERVGAAARVPNRIETVAPRNLGARVVQALEGAPAP
ncbi:MAG TPA: homoserine kinase [Candidatus Eisenbacteria bacterium]|nr:homoserine kinase [Candidatus Eisenbacteria bacterium]